MILPVLSAVLLAIATMLPGGAPLTLIALVPLFVGLRQTMPGWSGWKIGYLFGLVYGLAQLAWIFSLTARWTGSTPLAIIPYLLAVGLFAIYFGLFGWLSRRLFVVDRTWAIPILWAGVEVFRSYLPVFAFPWGLLATPWHAYPVLMQPASVGTIYLVSALIAWLNLALVLKSRKAIVVGLFTYGITSVANLPSGRDSVQVAVLQPGVDMAYGDATDVEFKLGRSINGLLAQAQGADLTVLPEGIARAGSRLPPSTPFQTPSFPILFGGQRGSGPYYQSAFGWNGRTWHSADKTRLVIFGEFVPGRDFLPFLRAFRLPAGDLTAGTGGVRSLPFGFGKVGPVLCFEALFPDISARMNADGARALAIMSIDDWFMGTQAPEQLRAAAAWRAVENRMPVFRAATTGRSEIVNATGAVVSDGGYGKSMLLQARINIPDKGTPPWLLAFFPVFATMVGLVTPWFPRLARGKSDTRRSDPRPEPFGPL